MKSERSIPFSPLLRKVVIPAAGLGTRLLPATKELPKEMLPIFAINSSGKLCTKPLLQLLFEQLCEIGFSEFCFVVGRGKRAIEDHFTPDWGFLQELERRGKTELASSLEDFYKSISNSKLVWINQPEPKGFGHAVLMAEPFVAKDPFLVLAGDTYIVSKENDHLKRLIRAYKETGAEAVITLQEVEKPRMYGVAITKGAEKEVLLVERVIEKPREPPSNFAIMPIYIFEPVIFDALREIGLGVGGEIQLTDGIQRLIDRGAKVVAIKLREDELRLDIGTPETYWKALKLSYEVFTQRDKRL